MSTADCQVAEVISDDTSLSSSSSSVQTPPKFAIGTAVSFPFDEGWFQGKVESVDWIDGILFYLVRFDDDDQAHYTQDQIARHLLQPSKKRGNRKSKPARPTKRSKVTGVRRRRSVNYAETHAMDQDDDDEDFSDSFQEDEDEDLVAEATSSEDEKPVAKKARGVTPKNNKRTTRHKTVTITPSSTSKTTTAAAAPKKKMSECFQPINYPSFRDLSLSRIHEEKEYLDPCGMEGTDDVIDRLVGEQVDKIGHLLRAVLEHKNVGSPQVPLQLGTACSGTDAPALAMTLVQEQLEKRGITSFTHTHEFSCEVDPFKQAYLARNFDSVLYPDICKLTDTKPRDVFGQEKAIPPFNLFVAGTSCKNFSMMRSNKRLDIEDKGCSGETFLAATEVLFQEKPAMAIFENVIAAPWGKMQEYITGRIKLSDCASTKAIKGASQADKHRDLEFIQVKGAIVVDKVPANYGVRYGSVVAGYLRPGSEELQPLKFPSKKAKSCTLADLIKTNDISKKDDTLVFQTDCTFCTHIVKVDTKEFGLPQTRMRTYMFVWRPDQDDVHDDLGTYWEAIVKHLQSPVRHSLQSFVLPVDHDIIRAFREACKADRVTTRAVFGEPDFWASANANLPHNKNARKFLGMADRARSTTGWDGFGKKQVPPHYWLEYMKCNFARPTDMLDILSASSARDAECHDANFVSYYWNISQNASKEKHRSACPGIAGCITPGGDFFLPNEGRPLLGCEKLMVQGIPYFRLVLGNETEVQLGDLAGNAMSLTVVCACMLAAVSCAELRRQTGDGTIKAALAKASLKNDSRKASIKNKRLEQPKSGTATAKTADAFIAELASLSSEAVASSIQCTCETSGSNSVSQQFLQCSICRVSCCRACINSVAGYNLMSHQTEEISLSPEQHNAGVFLSKLRAIVPSTLVLSPGGVAELVKTGGKMDQHRVASLSRFTLNLHRMKRDRRKWTISYMAREDDGFGDAVAEFVLTVGEINKSQKASGCEVPLGVKGTLTSFFPAKDMPLVFGPLEPCAVFYCKNGERGPSWYGRCGDTECSLQAVGEGETDSFRVDHGLTQVAADSLEESCCKKHIAKFFDPAQKRGEERRWKYAENWQVWPESITLSESGEDNGVNDALCCVYGEYQRAKCRQTTNQSALWVQKTAGPDETIHYILIQPNVGRTGPDTAIVSTSISHDDADAIQAVFPWKWQPCDALVKKRHKVQNVKTRSWTSLTSMNLLVPSSTISVEPPKEDEENVLVSVTGLSPIETSMLCRGSDSGADELVEIPIFRGQVAQNAVRAFSSICVAPILTYGAKHGFMYSLEPDSPWQALDPSGLDVELGQCTKTIPKRPSESWFFDDERAAWFRRSDSGASREYYRALQQSPQAFELWVNKVSRTLLMKCFPEVVAHRAANCLIEGRGNDTLREHVSVVFRLSDITQQKDPVIKPFQVRNCDTEGATLVKLNTPYELYVRQQRVVTKMLKIEQSKTEFEEVELSEQEMPGSGISIIAKASANHKLCGGVIADAIGSGKTVVSIALILNGLKAARAARSLPNQCSATLVVVPTALVDQWGSEIKKFAPRSLKVKVTKVYDYKGLKQLSLSDILHSDVVVCPVNLLESDGYLQNLISWSKVDVPGVPKIPTYSGYKEQHGVRGVWIPATSANPYAGNETGPASQRKRNEAAYFTHVYLKSVRGLRDQEFKPTTKGVPLEFFRWERVIVDEIHESLCVSRMKKEDGTKETDSKNKKLGRELLGITEKNIALRPLIFRTAIYGLTGTPLLDNSSRVVELANLMGNTYVTGLSAHWRKLERESGRDLFLHSFLEPKQSREVRRTIQHKCQDYLFTACCRNRTGKEMDGIKVEQLTRVVKMSKKERDIYLGSQSGIPPEKRSLGITIEDFDVDAGADIHKFLTQNANLRCRQEELVAICYDILSKDKETKIVVFVDGDIDGDVSASSALNESGLGCTQIMSSDSVETQNQKISWYQNGDATAEDRARPRILVLQFEHAAGLNLQAECFNMVLYTPLYIGEGGATGDAVSDASTELQAVGRLFRPGQTRPQVNVYRIEVRGPDGEECVDGQLIRRNTDDETLAMAVNADD